MQVSPHASRCQCAGWAAAGGEGRLELQGVIPQDVDAALHSNTQWLEDCSIRLLCVLALDRFGDFTSDQVQCVVAILQPVYAWFWTWSLLCWLSHPGWLHTPWQGPLSFISIALSHIAYAGASAISRPWPIRQRLAA